MAMEVRGSQQPCSPLSPGPHCHPFKPHLGMPPALGREGRLSDHLESSAEWLTSETRGGRGLLSPRRRGGGTSPELCSTSSQATALLGNAEPLSWSTVILRAWSAWHGRPTLRLGLWPGVSCGLGVLIKAMCFSVCLCVPWRGEGWDGLPGVRAPWAYSLHSAPHSFIQSFIQQTVCLCATAFALMGETMRTE